MASCESTFKVIDVGSLTPAAETVVDGTATDDSSIQFDNCIINKDSGTLISGSSVKDESATSLNVIFKGGSVNKELDTTWCNGKEGIHIQYK